jgi:type II secretory pathway pseudopilin PulG
MHTCRGVTLVELVVALALASAVCVSAAGALIASRALAGHARDEAVGVAMAGARLDALLAAAGAPPLVPADALWTDHAGHVDYLDATGRVLGAAPAHRAQAAYVRRWWQRREAAGAQDLVVAAVLVAPAGVADRNEATAAGARLAEQPGVVVRRGARLRTAP